MGVHGLHSFQLHIQPHTLQKVVQKGRGREGETERKQQRERQIDTCVSGELLECFWGCAGMVLIQYMKRGLAKTETPQPTLTWATRLSRQLHTSLGFGRGFGKIGLERHIEQRPDQLRSENLDLLDFDFYQRVCRCVSLCVLISDCSFDSIPWPSLSLAIPRSRNRTFNSKRGSKTFFRFCLMPNFRPANRTSLQAKLNGCSFIQCQSQKRHLKAGLSFTRNPQRQAQIGTVRSPLLAPAAPSVPTPGVRV